MFDRFATPPYGVKLSLLVAVCGLVFAASAGATTAPWTATDMKTAVRGLGYPKPHPKKLACKPGGGGFRCVATYRQHRHRRFVIGSVAGPWLCAGKTMTGCTQLRHGFDTDRQIQQRYGGTLPGAALFAARAYMQVKYGMTYLNVAPGGGQTGPTTWTYSYYTSDTDTVLVTITLKPAKGGYVVVGSSA